MGNNNCDSIKNAFVHNICSRDYTDIQYSYNGVANGQVSLINNFCTYSGNTGKTYRQDWCSRVGQNSKEWSYLSQNNDNCKYDSCIPYNSVTANGSCHGCSAKSGAGTSCTRDKFTGTDINCCLNDYTGCNLSPSETSFVKQEGTNNCFTKLASSGSYCNSYNIDCGGACEPCLRDVTSDSNTNYYAVDVKKTCTSRNTCKDVIMKYCTGSDLDIGNSSWINRWMKPDGTPVPKGCYYAVLRNIYYIDDDEYSLSTQYPGYPSDAGGGSNASGNCSQLVAELIYTQNIIPSNQKTCQGADPPVVISDHPKIPIAKQIVSDTMLRYQQDGFILGSLPGTTGYNPFQDFMQEYLFCRFPFLAKDTLKKTCGQYTTSQLETNPSIANLCGCYLRDVEYQKYVNLYQVNIECTPQCNRTTVTPLTDDNGNTIYCDQDICIIDDVSISLSGSDINDLNISQMCGNCHTSDQPNSPPNSGSSCTCTFSDNTYDISQSDLNQLNVNQTCTTSNCTIVNELTGQTETLPCDQVSARENVIKQQEILEEQQRRDAIQRRNRNILIFLGIIVLIILILGYFINPLLKDPIAPSKKNKNKTTMNKNKNKTTTNKNTDKNTDKNTANKNTANKNTDKTSVNKNTDKTAANKTSVNKTSVNKNSVNKNTDKTNLNKNINTNKTTSNKTTNKTFDNNLFFGEKGENEIYGKINSKKMFENVGAENYDYNSF